MRLPIISPVAFRSANEEILREGDDDKSGEIFDGSNSIAAGFCDAGGYCRGDCEEYDDDGVHTVDKVSQGTTSQTGCRSENYDDRDYAGYSTSENEGEQDNTRGDRVHAVGRR